MDSNNSEVNKDDFPTEKYNIHQVQDPILKPATILKPPSIGVPESSPSATKTSERKFSTTYEDKATTRMLDIIYWRNPIKTGIVFGAILLILICFAVFPTISVLAYTGLLMIAAVLAFRLFLTLKTLTNKRDENHPFKPYLEKNLKLQSDRIHRKVDLILSYVQKFFDRIQNIILVENFADTLKVAVVLWALTYIGAYLSTMTFAIFVVIGIFTIPKTYQSFKPQIDHNYEIARLKVKHAQDILHEKLHHLKKKAHAHAD